MVWSYTCTQSIPQIILIPYIYIWVHGSNSPGSSVFAEIPFLAFLALHRESKRCGQVGPSPCYSQREVICIPSFRSVAPRVFLAKIPFLAFLLPW